MSAIVATVELGGVPAGVVSARYDGLVSDYVRVVRAEPEYVGADAARLNVLLYVLGETGLETVSQVLAHAYAAVAKLPGLNEARGVQISIERADV